MKTIVQSEGHWQASLFNQSVIAAIGVAALYCGRQILIPIALASLLSFVLTPPLTLLQRIGLRRGLSVAAVTLVSFTLLTVIVGEVGRQGTEVAENLPQYESGLSKKLQSLRDSAKNGPVMRSAERIVSGLTSDLGGSEPSRPVESSNVPPDANARAQNPPPLPVVVRQPGPTPYDIASQFLGPLIEPLAATAITIVFVVFILLERDGIRDRLIWLLGARDIRRTTNVLDDAGARLSRYFLAQTAVNAAFGVLFGAGLWLIGIPNFALWGFLAMLLRFLPYIGAPMAAAFPLILSAAIEPGWTTLLWTAGLFVVLEGVTGQIVEPNVFGRTTGMSPLAVVAAAAFWTVLWGPIGLFLSTPLTLLLVVLGQHVQAFKVFAALLGDTPPLQPDQSFYHKIITGRAGEALEQAYLVLEDHSLAAYYDEYALPGLGLLQRDLILGVLSHDNLEPIVATVDEIIDALDDVDEKTGDEKTAPDGQASKAGETEPTDPPPSDRRPQKAVLCLAGRRSFDLSAAAMLAQVLRKQHVDARVIEGVTAASYQSWNVETPGVALICLSYLAVDHSPSHVRALTRRLRRRMPGIPILACFWTYDETGDDDADGDRLKAESGADIVASSLKESVAICLREVAAAPTSRAAESIEAPAPKVA